ncbi:MAG: hypothetical protein LBH91_04850 [Prevotellaceae bacterium]|jgi:uncharacterized transporter YbjL|nr:hypothetical protein [Prevotellaceae bacterium]
MAGKFTLDIEDEFAYIKQSKQKQANKTQDETDISNSHVDNIDVNNINVDNINIDNIDIQKKNNHIMYIKKQHIHKKREPSSVIALRSQLLLILGNNKEIIIKMKEIAQDIGYSLSWMQFAMKYLTDAGEFTFTRYAEGKYRGMKVRKLSSPK